MCGIMGFVGRPLNAKAADLSYQLATKLLAETVVRGSHATGIYGLLPPKEGSDRNRMYLYKLDAPSPQFVKTEHWKGIRADGEPYLLLGHCRYFTHGSPQDHINNHPHVSDDKKLSLIHNGVISGYEGLKKTYDVQGECDSEILLRIIETEDDVIEGIRKIFRVVTSGTMACMVSKYDQETKKTRFYAFRNDGNPLHFVDLRPQLGQMFLSSTEKIMEDSIKNSGMPKAIQEADILEIPSYEIWSCDSEELEWETEKVTKVVGGYSGYGCGHRNYNNTSTTTSTSTTSKENEKIKGVRSLIDVCMESLTEIDEGITTSTKDDELKDLEEKLKYVAWGLEKIINPSLDEGDSDQLDTEYFD